MAYKFATLRNDQRIGVVRASPVYLPYPTIFQKQLMPDDVFVALNSRWSSERSPARNVEFYLLKDVFVLAEGLVFNSAGELIPGTQVGHPDAAIQIAHAELESILATSQDVVSMPRGVLCKKAGAGNYGHWLIEMLPKAFLTHRELGLNDWPIIVHTTSVEMYSIIKQSLAVIGISDDLIHVTDRSPLFFRELIVINGLTSHSVYISPLVMECMDFIASKAPMGSAERIYVPRRPATTRDFEHEPQVAKLFGDEGYSETITANLSFLEQVSTFKTAESVIGAMGAAMSNIAFCRPGTEVVIFGPASARELFFWLLACGRSLHYFEVRCMEVGDVQGLLPWNRSLQISLSSIKKVIRATCYARKLPELPIDALEQPNSQIKLNVDYLTSSSWALLFSNSTDCFYNVIFCLDGTISGYSHHNEQTWRINSGVLEFIGAHGLTTWRFDHINMKDGAMQMRSRYLLNSNIAVVLFLQENPRATTEKKSDETKLL